ncbi:hypothetical protein L218DRAFT_985409 [Marasmius fiardii PR-910]|nr:hypothetical protein L218DRAFT_985409 [Marasmius fiardii PR-910]
MGFRHQAYVIARIGSTYRWIGGWYSYECYGAVLVQGGRRFIDLVKVKSNVDIIREELKAFPLMNQRCAFSVNVENGDYVQESRPTRAGVIPAWMDPSDGLEYYDNSEGISVFDVTDPQNPAYIAQKIWITFLSVQKTTSHKPGMKTRNVLMEKQDGDVEDGYSEDDSDVLEEPGYTDTIVPSLADLLLKPVIDQAVTCDVPEPLEPVILIRGKGRCILKDNPLDIDLSYLRLSSDNILQILSGLEKPQPIQCLNLSHNKNVSTSTLRVVLKAHPTTRRIVLYETSISDEDLYSLLHLEPSLFYGVEQVIHPSLFSFEIPCRESLHPAFIFYSAGDSYAASAMASFPLLNLTLILQSVSDLLRVWIYSLKLERDSKTSMRQYLNDSQLAYLSVFSSGLRTKDQRWGERAVVQCPLPTPNAFFEGWMFVLYLPSHYNPLGRRRYGFIRPKSKIDVQAQRGLPEYEIHDLDSFITTAEAEGYPQAPVGAVDEKVADSIKHSGWDWGQNGLLHYSQKKSFMKPCSPN